MIKLLRKPKTNTAVRGLSFIIALSFIAVLGTTFLSLSKIPPASYYDDVIQPNQIDSSAHVQVFYNIFVKNEDDEERVRAIIDEQLAFLDPDVHNKKVLVTSIGHLANLANITNAVTREHQPEGSEALTLHAIWDFCRENHHHETKVVYLHSKGSFHDTPQNERLRSFLTKGALSKECANLPESCNVCSSRMSPLPHPHTPGNMWLARCDYVANLIDPYALQQGKLPVNFQGNNPCRGFGRSFYEHWVHSHPSVMPCDLYSGEAFTWGYTSIP
jgi:hypothetical protein